MSEQNPQVVRQERFNSLLNRMRSRADEEILGVFGRTLELGQTAIRFSVFDPREVQPKGYNPSILFQDLVEGEAHNGPYWAPVSEIYLRRDKLENNEADEKLAELESKLDLFEKILDFDSETSG